MKLIIVLAKDRNKKKENKLLTNLQFPTETRKDGYVDFKKTGCS